MSIILHLVAGEIGALVEVYNKYGATNRGEKTAICWYTSNSGPACPHLIIKVPPFFPGRSPGSGSGRGLTEIGGK